MEKSKTMGLLLEKIHASAKGVPRAAPVVSSPTSNFLAIGNSIHSIRSDHSGCQIWLF